VAFVVALVLGACSATAWAALEGANAFYQQALQAYQAGEYHKADKLLQRAYAEDPNLMYPYNRIMALEAAGDYEDALEVLEIYRQPMLEDEKERFDDVVEIEKRLNKEKASSEATDTTAADAQVSAAGGTESAEPSGAESIRMRRPNAIYLELFGHGMAHTINYERWVFDDIGPIGTDIGFGAGIGRAQGEIDYGLWTDSGDLTSFPVFVTTHSIGEHHGLLLQAGLDFLLVKNFQRTGFLGNTIDETDQQRWTVAFLEIGYQMHLESGFMFRAALSGSSAGTALIGLAGGWTF